MSKHRGCKEMDIILGGFAEKYLDQLTVDELLIYERLLTESDAIIYDAIMNIICNKGAVDNQLHYSRNLLIKIAIWHKNEYPHQF